MQMLDCQLYIIRAVGMLACANDDAVILLAEHSALVPSLIQLLHRHSMQLFGMRSETGVTQQWAIPFLEGVDLLIITQDAARCRFGTPSLAPPHLPNTAYYRASLATSSHAATSTWRRYYASATRGGLAGSPIVRRRDQRVVSAAPHVRERARSALVLRAGRQPPASSVRITGLADNAM